MHNRTKTIAAFTVACTAMSLPVMAGGHSPQIAVVPEPSGMLALLTGVIGIAGVVGRRRR